MLLKFFLLWMFFFFTVFPAFAQQTFDFEIPQPERRSLAPENPEPVPRQFREFSLGMGLEELKSVLAQDRLFHFRGDRDVSFLPIRQETIVETTGPSFVRRAFFQLSGESVYIMSFTLDPRLVDHYSVFTSFVRRYGEPVSLNPGESVWESEGSRVSIERPLTVKYVDKNVFNRLVEESRSQENRQMIRREDFLADF